MTHLIGRELREALPLLAQAPPLTTPTTMLQVSRALLLHWAGNLKIIKKVKPTL